MELKFECPTCGQHISATPAQIGVTAPCPNCNTAVTVSERFYLISVTPAFAAAAGTARRQYSDGKKAQEV